MFIILMFGVSGQEVCVTVMSNVLAPLDWQTRIKSDWHTSPWDWEDDPSRGRERFQGQFRAWRQSNRNPGPIPEVTLTFHQPARWPGHGSSCLCLGHFSPWNRALRSFLPPSKCVFMRTSVKLYLFGCRIGWNRSSANTFFVLAHRCSQYQIAFAFLPGVMPSPKQHSHLVCRVLSPPRGLKAPDPDAVLVSS